MKENVEKIQQWKKEKVTPMYINVRNDTHLLERIALAVDSGLARSRQAYVLAAIEAALDRDGVPRIEDEKSPASEGGE